MGTWVCHPRGSWGPLSAVLAEKGHGSSRMHEGVGGRQCEAGRHLVERGRKQCPCEWGGDRPCEVGQLLAVQGRVAVGCTRAAGVDCSGTKVRSVVGCCPPAIGDVVRVSNMRPLNAMSHAPMGLCDTK